MHARIQREPRSSSSHVAFARSRSFWFGSSGSVQELLDGLTQKGASLKAHLGGACPLRRRLHRWMLDLGNQRGQLENGRATFQLCGLDNFPRLLEMYAKTWAGAVWPSVDRSPLPSPLQVLDGVAPKLLPGRSALVEEVCGGLVGSLVHASGRGVARTAETATNTWPCASSQHATPNLSCDDPPVRHVLR